MKDNFEPRYGFVNFAEIWNGRLAMMGILIGLTTELLTGQGILTQMGIGWKTNFLVFLFFKSLTDLKNAKQSLTTYSVKELNESIGLLLSRGFAPKFILEAAVSKSQIKKKVHLWLTLTDGKASVDAVAWSSTIKSLKFLPKQDDGVVIIGKLNFWESQARVSVQVFDIRPSISTVLRKFEIVKSNLF